MTLPSNDRGTLQPDTAKSRPIDPTCKLGKCKWCGDDGEIYRDSLLCDPCDNDTIYCNVCRERVSYGFKCRHVFQDACCEWHGSGYDSADPSIRKPFLRFLSVMGEEFARDLKTAIAGGGFHTWLVAPMIGGGGSLTLYGMPRRDGDRFLFGDDWGDKIIALGEGARADEFADAYGWLASLFNRDTSKANRTTIRWIDQWLWPLTPNFGAPDESH